MSVIPTVRTEYTYNLFIDDERYGIHDGDTFRGLIRIDLGFKKYYSERMDFRLHGIDTPEVKTQRIISDIKIRAKHKLAGIYVREFVKPLLFQKWVTITTHKELDKYGRVLTDVEVMYNGGRYDLTELLTLLGYGKPYFGGTKDEWTEKDLDHIINKLGSNNNG